MVHRPTTTGAAIQLVMPSLFPQQEPSNNNLADLTNTGALIASAVCCTHACLFIDCPNANAYTQNVSKQHTFGQYLKEPSGRAWKWGWLLLPIALLHPLLGDGTIPSFMKVLGQTSALEWFAIVLYLAVSECLIFIILYGTFVKRKRVRG